MFCSEGNESHGHPGLQAEGMRAHLDCYLTLHWDETQTHTVEIWEGSIAAIPQHWVTGGLTGTEDTLPVPFFPWMDRRSLAGGSCQEDYSLCPYESQPEPSHLQSLEGEQLA